MSNKYILTIRNKNRAGSRGGFLDDLISNVSGGQITSTQDLVKKAQKETKVQRKRINNISTLSEANMELLNQDLEMIEKTIRIYNVVGYASATAATLGSILLGIRLYKKVKRRRL